MSAISDKIEELISLKRLKGCEFDGLADWSFTVGQFRFEKFKNLRNKNKKYYIYVLGESIYKEFQQHCGYTSFSFSCLDKENMSFVIKITLDEEIEKELKKIRKKEEKFFCNFGKIGIFKRIFNFIWRIK